MTNQEAIKLIDDRMCWGRGRWSKHHMPEIDEYWQAGLMAIEALKAQIATDTNVGSKYEYHYDHTDCIWYRPEARNRCPTTCAQYRDGWNDAMNYIFRDGKGYRPYRRDKQYGE